MKISGSNEIGNYVNKSHTGETKKTGDKTGAMKERQQQPREGAIVDISQRSKDVQKVQKAILGEPEVRMEKVKTIKEQIEKGEYKIDYDGTAEKILKAFFDDMA